MNELPAGFDVRKLEELLARFASLRVAVFGDFFLDKYLEVDPGLAERSLETGRIAHQVVEVRHSAGAAGTVVNNVAALGTADMEAVGFTGEDGEGYELRADLTALGCGTEHLHVDNRRRTPTYLKPRDADSQGLEGEHSRYDIKNRRLTAAWLEQRIRLSLDTLLPSLDVLIVVDQVDLADSGAVTGGLRDYLADRAAHFPHVVVWADSRRRIASFRRLTLKMNQFELTGRHDPAPGTVTPEEEILSALPRVEARAQGRVFATAAERGVWVGGTPPLHVPAVALPGPVDPTGAGDSFTAGAALSLAAGASAAEAALVGNLVASVTVRMLATTGVARPGELAAALELWREQNP